MIYDVDGFIIKDFKPGTIFEIEMNKGAIHLYTVLDPARTRNGKLRLEGPKGGYKTTWWFPNNLDTYRPTIRINK